MSDWYETVLPRSVGMGYEIDRLEQGQRVALFLYAEGQA